MLPSSFKGRDQYGPDRNKENLEARTNLESTRAEPAPMYGFLEPPAIITVNIDMLQKIIASYSTDNFTSPIILFKALEMWAHVKQITPFIVTNGEREITIDCKMEVSSELRGVEVVVILERAKEGMIRLKSVRKAQAKEKELFELYTRWYTRKYSVFQDVETRMKSKSRSRSESNDSKESKKAQKTQGGTNLTPDEQKAVQAWMEGQSEFSVEEMVKHFGRIKPTKLNAFLDARLLQGVLANLENNFVWMG